MRHIKTYQVFESGNSITPLTKDQITWLNSCSYLWKINPKTGLVDVYGAFDIGRENLKDFKGVMLGKVSGYFNCSGNQLTSLEGAPQTVGQNFYCQNNQLTSLIGGPKKVSGSYNISGNPLTSFEGAPDKSKGLLFYGNNTAFLPPWETPNERDQTFWDEFKLNKLPLLLNSISTGFLNSLIEKNPGDFILNIKSVIKNPDCAEKISELNLKGVAKKIGNQLGDVASLGF